MLAQSFRDWELLFINDGSTDGTGVIAAQYAEKDSRIRILTFSENRGIVAALNAGLSEAKGKYIARMDADDESHAGRLQKQFVFLEENPSTGLVSCKVLHGGDSNEQQGYALYIDWINRLQEPGAIFLQRFVESPFAHPSVMFRKELVDLFGGYRAGDFPEDYELWLRWMDKGVRMARLPDLLFTWNDLPARLSRKDARCSPDAFARCKSVYLAAFLKTEIPPAKKIWLCGAGRITRQRSSFLLGQGINAAGYIDVDPGKIGKNFGGLPVISLDQLGNPGENFVISYIGNRGAREDIRAILISKGFTEGAGFIMAG
ncbi:MAG: family 2 glycosyl transferase [Bacteroidetes bacterium]|nr:MAG: family 2 glycosyl transferase [Bacteroidota bacterium]